MLLKTSSGDAGGVSSSSDFTQLKIILRMFFQLQVVLMMHGWPDSSAIWDRTADALLESGRFVCVRYDL